MEMVKHKTLLFRSVESVPRESVRATYTDRSPQ